MDPKLALSCVLIVGGAVGVALPVFHAEEQLTQAASSTNAETLTIGSLQETPVSGWGDEIILDRERDGHFYADVNVDGVSSRMLVDTGASVVALTGDDARAMGLYWDESEVRPVAQGASGAVHGVHTTLPRVRVGEFVANDVQAIIVPQGLGISLLGQSFLGTIDNVSIVDDRMVLGG
ncbi:TIGR02281 family clan AA aspartic protease [Aurantiacibacter sp. MUD11]|uniref:retropepsin-like aspartic protease family protein n=1 Tax=Aurantiacibacter sp. MUD11 TaxID=3003265 RepID=UPI0022AAD2C8|nr:TIGR02281 family clan AA aspartic protease [Aurantiacibacter sp. MUD11]WAT16743.1 TIGR02281 family clan AA aspartic protease [Aurantiacibacter sp. MUD11]